MFIIRCKSTNIRELVNWQSYALAMFRKTVFHDAGIYVQCLILDGFTFMKSSHTLRFQMHIPVTHEIIKDDKKIKDGNGAEQGQIILPCETQTCPITQLI